MTLTEDFHVHLYGVLSSEDIWTLGRDRYKNYADRLSWYEQEFEKATKKKISARLYWDDPNGLELLKSHYEMSSPGDFSIFQAKFNLLIALFPLVPSDCTVLRYVAQKDQRAGLTFAEYRTPFPRDLNFETIKSFCQCADDLNQEFSGAFTLRLAFSLARDPLLGLPQWEVLKKGISGFEKMVSGIDFCGSEIDAPPQLSKPLIELIKKERPSLAILMHVGEQYSHLSQDSALRLIYDAARLNCDRLGHATALGTPPQSQEGQEPVAVRTAHLKWLINEAPSLKDLGYVVHVNDIKKELTSLASQPPEKLIKVSLEFETLRPAITAYLKKQGSLLETCPTSNSLIGQISSLNELPFTYFSDHHLDFIVGRDDPGIFNITLEHELNIVKKITSIETLQTIAVNANRLSERYSRS